MVQRVVPVGTVYNSRQKNEARIVFEAVFFEERLKSAFLALVAKLNSLDIKGGSAQSLCIAQDTLRRNKEEFRLRIYEFLDQPWAGHPIHVHSFARNPFHDFYSLGCGGSRQILFPITESAATAVLDWQRRWTDARRHHHLDPHHRPRKIPPGARSQPDPPLFSTPFSYL